MVSPAQSAHTARPPWWPFLVSAALLLGALWLLDTRQPAAWPEAATPWFGQVRALAPATWVVDRLNAHAMLAPDVPLGSAAVLLATVLCTLATLLAIEVPSTIAVAVAIGLAASRSLWSTASADHDALPVAVVAGAVAALTWPSTSRHVGAAAAVATLACSPAAAPIVLPAALAAASTVRQRLWLGAGLVLAAAGAQLYLLRDAWMHVGCLAPAAWTSAISEVLRPGESADASAWLAVRQLLAVFTGDVHILGVAVAAVGMVQGTSLARSLRGATIGAMAIALVVVATGVLPPALTAALLLPWWAPWFGVGLTVLVRLAGQPQARLAMAFAIVLATVLPLLRHATVIPGPWRSGMPATARAVSATWHGGVVAIEDAALARRLRLLGATSVPADPRTLAACVASGRDVFAIGAMVTRVQQLGHRVIERPLRSSLAAIIHDVRTNQLVALALAPGAIAWAGPVGFTALARLGVTRDTPASMAVALIARTDRGGDVRTGRQGIDLTGRVGDVVAGRQLLAPVWVGAHEADTRVESAPLRLTAGRHAAIAVFDRGHEPVLLGVGAAAPGLPIALTNQPAWRHALVRGQPRCVNGSTTWMALPEAMSRLSIPIDAATPADPAVVLLGSESPPQITTSGFTIEPVSVTSRITVFDRQSPAEVTRLREMLRHDRVPPADALQGRWVARIELGARSPWHAGRASITPGVAPAGWLVRLASSGSRADNIAVCDMVAGERVLAGRASVDDETAREVPVTVEYGWHPPERFHRDVFQWSASATATATFVLERPIPIVLAMDATAASTPAGRQPLSVRINDVVVSQDWPGAERTTVPVDALHAGANTITLSVPQAVRPGHDRRMLGVLIRQLRIIAPEGR